MIGDNMKKGLVLEGGAMRGMFTAGVLDVMMENGIEFDGLAGVSAGAVFGCNYKSKQIGRTIRYNMKYCKDKRYCSIYSLLTTGDLYGKDFCYNKIPNELDVFDDETFDNNPMEFYVVCTDVTTGRPVYKKCDKCDDEYLEWFRASASMPIVSRIVEVGGYKLLDGGISDSIPLKYMESIGYDKNVVVLTQPKDYTKKKNKLLGLMKLVLNKYPGVVKAMETRHDSYNETVKYICEKEDAGQILVIRPAEKLPVGRIEKSADNLKKAYDIGRETAKLRIDEIKRFLA